MGTTQRLQGSNMHCFHTVEHIIMLYKNAIPTHILALTILDKARSCKMVKLLLSCSTQPADRPTDCCGQQHQRLPHYHQMALYFIDALTVNYCSPPSSIWLLWFCMVASSSQCCLFCLTPSTRGSRLSDNTANDWQIQTSIKIQNLTTSKLNSKDKKEQLLV